MRFDDQEPAAAASPSARSSIANVSALVVAVAVGAVGWWLWAGRQRRPRRRLQSSRSSPRPIFNPPAG